MRRPNPLLRAARPWLGLLILAQASIGCRGCGSEPTPDVPPTRYVAADAETVLVIKDYGILTDAKKLVASKLSQVVSEDQLQAAVKELELAFGFDATSPDGLTKAGLPARGTLVAQVVAGGAGALWILPVGDEKKLAETLDKLIEARVSVDETSDEKRGEATMKVFRTAFGPKKVVVAARAFHGGYAFIGAGAQSVELIARATALPEKDAITASPVYQGHEEALGEASDVLVVSPEGDRALGAVLDRLAKMRPELKPIAGRDPKHLASAAWGVDFTPTGAVVRGRVGLDEEGRATATKLFAPKGQASAGVKAVHVTGAVLQAQVGVSPKTVLDVLAPVGSPSRSRVERAFDQVRKDIETDVEKDLLPILTGHAALGVGVGDLSKVSFREVVGNPLGILWTAFAFGISDEKVAQQIEAKLDPGIEARGMKVEVDEIDGQPVRSVVPPSAGEAEVAPIVETMTRGGAWIYSNEPLITRAVIANETASGALGGRPGLYVELSFRTLSQQLESFRYGDLPILYRSVLAKIVDAIRLLNALQIRVTPSEDGLDVRAELSVLALMAAQSP